MPASAVVPPVGLVERGVAGDQLVVDGGRDVGQGEPTPPRADGRVEHDLVEQVTELGAELVGALAGVGVVGVDRLEHLVRLLEQVPLERVVGLLGLPRVLDPEASDQLVEAHHLGRDRRSELGDPQRGEVVGRDRTVQLRPVDLEDRLVRQPQPLQHRDGNRAAIVHQRA